MAFADQHTHVRLKPIAGVALVHLAIGYAFISGLATDVMRHVPTVIQLIELPSITPPPPNAPEPPRAAQAQPRAVATPRPEVALPPSPAVDPVVVQDIAPIPTPALETVRVTPPPPPASQASTAQARGDRRGWITADDYPSRALRNGEEGAVGITLRIGADGRVSDCAVTASSGSPQLDEATCRLYPRRARFAPARDDAGNPVAATFTDRIRWTIPR